MKVYLKDDTIKKDYSGATTATILREEFYKVRPNIQPRRLDFNFKYGIPTEIDDDLALFLIDKYPNRFISVNRFCEPVPLGDELTDLGYKSVHSIICDINRKLKDHGQLPMPIIGGRDAIIERIREFRMSNPYATEIAAELAAEQSNEESSEEGLDLSALKLEDELEFNNGEICKVYEINEDEQGKYFSVFPPIGDNIFNMDGKLRTESEIYVVKITKQ